MYLREAVADVLGRTPPEVRGAFLAGRLRALIGYEGDGPERRFWFDGVAEPLSYRQLIRVPSLVAFQETDRTPRLMVEWSRRVVTCPACRRSLTVGGPFWEHYNQEHAQVPYWFNPEDWKVVIGGEYQPPFRHW